LYFILASALLVIRLEKFGLTRRIQVRFTPRRVLWMIVIPIVVVILALAVQNGL